MASLVTSTGGVKTPLSVLTRGNNNGNRTATAVPSDRNRLLLLDNTCPEKFSFFTGKDLAKFAHASKVAKHQASAVVAQQLTSRNVTVSYSQNEFKNLHLHQKVASFMKEIEAFNPSV